MFQPIMRRFLLICAAVAALASGARASDPMATRYSIRQCEGSLTPYPENGAPEDHPDSLVAGFINHVGRHGSRYPSSSYNCRGLGHARVGGGRSCIETPGEQPSSLSTVTGEGGPSTEVLSST